MTRNADNSYSLLTHDGVRLIRGDLLQWCFSGRYPNFYGYVDAEGPTGWTVLYNSWAGQAGTRDR